MYAISNVMSLEPKNKLSALQPSSGKESGKASENRLLWALIDWLPIKKNVSVKNFKFGPELYAQKGTCSVSIC